MGHRRTRTDVFLVTVLLALGCGGKTDIHRPSGLAEGPGEESSASGGASTTSTGPSGTTSSGGGRTGAGATTSPAPGGMPTGGAAGGISLSGSGVAGGAAAPTNTTDLPDTGAGGGAAVGSPNSDGLGCPGESRVPTQRSNCGGLGMGRGEQPTRLSLVVDASDAMNEEHGDGTRWEMVKDGILAFLEAVPPTTESVEIRLFPGLEADDSGCAQAAFREPVLSSSPEQADEIAAELEQIDPAGAADPAGALIQGLEAALATQSDDPFYRDYVVLITSGSIECSEPDPAPLLEAIRQANEGYVTTHVISLQPGFPPDEFGEATERVPFVIGGNDGSERVRDALLHIVKGGGASQCEAVVNAPASGGSFLAELVLDGSEVVPQVASAADCESSPFGGWYVQDSAGALSVVYCPCTCARASAAQTVEMWFECP